MRMLLLTTLFIALPDRPNPTPKKEAPPTLHQQILGDWVVVRLTIGEGKDAPIRDDARILRFGPKEIEILINGVAQANETADYTLDTNKTPPSFDLSPRSGKGMKIEGIVKVEGDTLTLCISPGGNRPTTFTTSGNPLQAIMYFKRPNTASRTR